MRREKGFIFISNPKMTSNGHAIDLRGTAETGLNWPNVDSEDKESEDCKSAVAADDGYSEEGEDQGGEEDDGEEEEEEEGDHGEEENVSDEAVEAEEVDGDELSGADPETVYHPFPILPEIVSKRYARIAALRQWLPIGPDGTMQLAQQSPNVNDPLSFPVVARFNLKCVRQTESELGQPVHIILLGYDESQDDPNRNRQSHASIFSIFYDGARTLDHLANVGDDDEVYPFSTLSSVGKLLYGTNCNGWKAIEICDVTSPHHGKSVGSIRRTVGGPGFRNTLNPQLLASWTSMTQKTLNSQANHQLDLLYQAILNAKSRATQASAPSASASSLSSSSEEEPASSSGASGGETKVHPKEKRKLILKLPARAPAHNAPNADVDDVPYLPDHLTTIVPSSTRATRVTVTAGLPQITRSKSKSAKRPRPVIDGIIVEPVEEDDEEEDENVQVKVPRHDLPSIIQGQ